MVWFAEDTDLKNSKDPSDILDLDFSFADSLLDFDSIQQWFEDKSSSDKPNLLHATNPSSIQISECEDLVTPGDAIEDGMAKISLSVAIPSEVMANDGESSSSSSSTSSGSSSSDSEEEQHPQMKGHEELEEGEIRDSATVDNVDDDDDDYGDGDASGTPIRSKNELETLPPVPPVDVTLEPHHRMQPVGVVMSIVGAKVIVEGLEKHEPLDEGSILWMTESRKPLGLIDEVFGPVKNPYYVVRYNSENEVPAGICGGAMISLVPEFANYVLNRDVYKKGYDASNWNDEEVSDESEFSDDEKEAEHRRMQRVMKRGINDQNRANRKNNRKKVPIKVGAVPTVPLPEHRNCPPLSGIGQGPNEADPIAPPFPPSVNPYSSSNGIQTTGSPFSQLQPTLLPNGFPTNGVTRGSLNPCNSFQLPALEIPFQQNLYPSQVSINMFSGVPQHNIYAQPTYAQGFMGQNQMAFGLSSHQPQFQPPLREGEQGVVFNQMMLERNNTLFPSISIPGNSHVPSQFHPGASAGRGRKTFQPGGRKGWRQAK